MDLSDCDLRGTGVLVTRPAPQAADLCALIEQRGGRPLAFPALEICPPEDREAAVRHLREPADFFIFISPNAVFHALRLLAGDRLPPGAKLAAVGKGTGRVLQQAGYRVDLQPHARFDSEGLLVLPALAELCGRRVVIVRGAGGRALLGQTLQDRGAVVVYAEVYRRQRPVTEPKAILESWSQQVDLVTVTSGEILDNLVTMLGQGGWPMLRRTPLLVISARMQAQARELGFETILQAQHAANEAVVYRICEWLNWAA